MDHIFIIFIIHNILTTFIRKFKFYFFDLIMIDRTISSKDTVHIMLTKPSVLDIAQKVVEEENIKNNNKKRTK